MMVVLARSRHRQLLAFLGAQLRGVADEGGDGRDLVVLVVHAEGGHARGADAVLDDPEELGVGVVLQGPVDVRRCRVHTLGEFGSLDAGSAVAGQAVLDVVLAAFREGGRIGGKSHLQTISAAPDCLEFRRHGDPIDEVGRIRGRHR
jgi:hypothetical protein